ncbi:MAG: hypothetical protein OXU74_06430 [Gemmatimonadota bacterium]|nr:hypothetical protein [Gemmatimonadota bacterium]
MGAPRSGDFGEYECVQCGEFDMTDSAEAVEITSRARVILAGQVRSANRLGKIPEINANHVAGFADQPLPSLRRRLKHCLAEALHSADHQTDDIDFGHPRFIAASFSSDPADMLRLAGMLVSERWVTKLADQGPLVRLTLLGHDQIDDD